MRGALSILALSWLLPLTAAAQPPPLPQPLPRVGPKDAEFHDAAYTELLSSYKEQSDAHQMQGRHADSERFLRRALELRESKLGPEHDDVARALQDLTRNLVLQSKLPDAEAAWKRAVAILEKNHGVSAPELFPVITLGVHVNQAVGNAAAAELLLLRTLSIRESIAGPDNFDLVADLVNLGEFYIRATRFPVAEPRFRRALAISEGKMGPDHPSLAPLLDKLASICRSLGRLPEAETFLRRALMLRERAFGPAHQDVASTLDALGNLLYAQKRYEESEALYGRSLPIWIAILGPNHSVVASSLDNLAVALASQNKFDPAAANYGKALAIREGAVVLSVYFLARVLDANGKTGESESLYAANKRLIDRLPESSDVLPVVLEHYASVLRKANKPAIATKIEAQSRMLERKKQNAKNSDQ